MRAPLAKPKALGATPISRRTLAPGAALLLCALLACKKRDKPEHWDEHVVTAAPLGGWRGSPQWDDLTGSVAGATCGTAVGRVTCGLSAMALTSGYSETSFQSPNATRARTRRTTLTTLAKEWLSKGWKYGAGALAAPFKCAYDALFGDGCDFSSGFDLADEYNPVTYVDGWIPGYGTHTSKDYTGIWHFMASRPTRVDTTMSAASSTREPARRASTPESSISESWSPPTSAGSR